jgi:hypothetical protein
MPKLLDIPLDWEREWEGMPTYAQENLMPWQTLKVHFTCLQDREKFAKLIGQRLTPKTQYVWHPKRDRNVVEGVRYAAQSRIVPRYPVYIVSKGRWKSRLTSRTLEAINVPYWIVVEPQEHGKYAKVIDPDKILTLPFSNLGKGSIPARNWIWEHAIKSGAERHWILDDNIRHFFRRNKNAKVKVSDGAIFRAVEDFADRYQNVGLAGMNYHFFAKNKQVIPPYVLNTRIYSCILIKNDLPYRWRGRYNEDTDLSLRVLRDGLCTVQFNAFLAGKQQTMTMKGGNTDELYQGDGRLKMAQALQKRHPNYVRIIQRFGRWQHCVNYHVFKNKLILKPDATKQLNFGIRLVKKQS